MSQEFIEQFCKGLEGQIRLDNKGVIALRRSYGKLLTDENVNMQAVSTFYKVLPDGVSKKDESTYFLCAVIAAYQGTCYGEKTLSQLVRARISDSSTFESKFNHILDLDAVDELYYDSLYSLIKRLGIRESENKGTKLDITKLLQDILYWEYRSIERESKPQKWAREVYQRKGEQ